MNELRRVPNINVQTSSGSSLERLGGEIILKNVPIKFEISNAELNVEFGQQSEINNLELIIGLISCQLGFNAAVLENDFFG